MNDEPITPKTHPISFLIIGAQKSGTTSLAKYLADHPDIFIPGAKEIEFFSDDKLYKKGFDWFYREFFMDARYDQIKGEASTHYMMYPQSPERIYETLPDIKLIAILRNPIDRAYSHYRMSCMRGRETRSFDAAVMDDLESSALIVNENHNYLRFGEYGRILENYLHFFKKEQIKVLFTEDLDHTPVSLAQEIYAFLEVPADYTPFNVGHRYNITGKKVIPGLDGLFRRVLRWVRRQWPFKKMLTTARYNELVFWSYTQLNIKPNEGEGVSGDIRKMLARHFAPDVAKLQELFGLRIPWPEFFTSKLEDTRCFHGCTMRTPHRTEVK